MGVITVPVNDRQQAIIKQMVKSGKAATKAHAVRMAIDLLEQEEAMQSVLRAQADVRAGRVFSGDLRELAKKIK